MSNTMVRVLTLFLEEEKTEFGIAPLFIKIFTYVKVALGLKNYYSNTECWNHFIFKWSVWCKHDDISSSNYEQKDDIDKSCYCDRWDDLISR